MDSAGEEDLRPLRTLTQWHRSKLQLVTDTQFRFSHVRRSLHSVVLDSVARVRSESTRVVSIETRYVHNEQLFTPRDVRAQLGCFMLSQTCNLSASWFLLRCLCSPSCQCKRGHDDPLEVDRGNLRARHPWARKRFNRTLRRSSLANGKGGWDSDSRRNVSPAAVATPE